MKQTLAFDVYGTLIDTSGVFQTLTELIGPSATAFMESWRQKQLEYSFRRGLMGSYVDFSVCTREALEYCCLKFDEDLTPQAKDRLMAAYTKLPVFEDVGKALRELQEEGHTLYAFSNGSKEAVLTLLESNNIHNFFQGVVSAKSVQTFKPDPKVYEYFAHRATSEKETSWLISGNAFDVFGAINYGMKAVWVKRSESAILDPWAMEPTEQINSLTELSSVLKGYT
ncbi:haloacid dehalogenase type II [Poritiphilus flavus]|uniref:Haloacid dehalogenase type II n=1 Tax=Poritiphilus flavus TaxID=2697053 RepID=A0A6L9EA26_9FLAO|nr:haloacid dehalogenase type II [Poritiphilus flavus]NAS11586.1 haloacid dehalogenase type II [Poritiphilus flavus]